MSNQPKSVSEVQEIVRSTSQMVPCGGGTKPALSTPVNGAVQVDMSGLSGIIEYQPSEYTFTAYAGTPVAKVVQALDEHGQYLPFDPLLVAQGATLGGTLAANTSGSGRLRYGSVRDFILGIQFVDGKGQLVRTGGKVVKNSAGFDVSKFMVGSLGRYGVFTELTFKVFPRPKAYATLKLTYANIDSTLHAVYKLAPKPFEIDALDLEPAADSDAFNLVARLGGLVDSLPGRLRRLQAFFESETDLQGSELLEGQVDTEYWAGVNGLPWVDKSKNLLKVPLTPKQIPALEVKLNGMPRRYSAGGNTAWLAPEDGEQVEQILAGLGLVGVRLYGPPGNPIVGAYRGAALAQRVKQVVDPDGKFLEATA